MEDFSSQRAPVLLVGVGNLLRRDDGVGVYAARALASRVARPELLAEVQAEVQAEVEIEVVEAGTAGLTLAPLLERRARVVVVDAIEAGAEPGAVFCLPPEALEPASASGLSLHDVHLLHALAETELLERAPAEVVVFAVQVGDVSSGIGLSPAVERALPGLYARVTRALGARDAVWDFDAAGATTPAARDAGEVP